MTEGEFHMLTTATARSIATPEQRAEAIATIDRIFYSRPLEEFIPQITSMRGAPSEFTNPESGQLEPALFWVTADHKYVLVPEDRWAEYEAFIQEISVRWPKPWDRKAQAASAIRL